jgi:hypothetical protein
LHEIGGGFLVAFGFCLLIRVEVAGNGVQIAGHLQEAHFLRSHTALTGIASTLHQSAPASESHISSSSATIVLRVSQSSLRRIGETVAAQEIDGD